MIPKEILSKVRQIEIRTGRLVNDIFAGEYESVFKGRGMEFHEVREYFSGDDIRSIDWNVTARMGHPYVKKFVEERQLTVVLLVDISASETFGTRNRLKSELLAELGAVLAFSAIKNNDKVGLILFTDRIEKFIPPKKGRLHVLRVIRELLYFKGQTKKTNIALALDYLGKVLRKRAVVFLISDFIDSGFEKLLRILNKRHDIVAIVVRDPREGELPEVGILELEDAETGEFILIDTRNRTLREEFLKRAQSARNVRNRFFKAIDLDAVEVSTATSYIEPLIKFFRIRAKRFR